MMQSSLFLNSLPELLSLFMTALVILLFTFGKQIINDKNQVSIEYIASGTAETVANYFNDNGYKVCDVFPGKDENKWLACLIKNDKFLIVTAFINGDRVEWNLNSLIQ